jgi:hypothetical protein
VTTLPTNSVPAGVAAMLSGKKLSPGTVRLEAFDRASRSRWVDAVAAGAHDTRATARQSPNAHQRRGPGVVSCMTPPIGCGFIEVPNVGL